MTDAKIIEQALDELLDETGRDMPAARAALKRMGIASASLRERLASMHEERDGYRDRLREEQDKEQKKNEAARTNDEGLLASYLEERNRAEVAAEEALARAGAVEEALGICKQDLANAIAAFDVQCRRLDAIEEVITHPERFDSA
jgi:septal ring factor EnvC (AmiA/AmiB activator)